MSIKFPLDPKSLISRNDNIHSDIYITCFWIVPNDGMVDAYNVEHSYVWTLICKFCRHRHIFNHTLHIVILDSNDTRWLSVMKVIKIIFTRYIYLIYIFDDDVRFTHLLTNFHSKFCWFLYLFQSWILLYWFSVGEIHWQMSEDELAFEIAYRMI